jgi:2-keto-3-deoxy-L-rhamnonate aldolase RhmA
MPEASLKDRLAGGEVLLGTWQKTPSAMVTEVLGRTGLDCLCLDAEHAPFDRGDLDAALLSAQATRMSCLVRVADASPAQILNALDLGATGVVVPHVASTDDARSAVANTRYGQGRGYAGSTRAADYTRRGIVQNLEAAQATVVVAQVEDASALDAIDDILAVDGIDCFFIGRADLAVSLGATSIVAPVVVDATHRIVDAAQRAGRRTGMFVGDLAEVPAWVELGVTLFLLESDHAFLLSGAASLRSRFDAADGQR